MPQCRPKEFYDRKPRDPGPLLIHKDLVTYISCAICKSPRLYSKYQKGFILQGSDTPSYVNARTDKGTSGDKCKCSFATDTYFTKYHIAFPFIIRFWKFNVYFEDKYLFNTNTLSILFLIDTAYLAATTIKQLTSRNPR